MIMMKKLISLLLLACLLLPVGAWAEGDAEQPVLYLAGFYFDNEDMTQKVDDGYLYVTGGAAQIIEQQGAAAYQKLFPAEKVRELAPEQPEASMRLLVATDENSNSWVLLFTDYEQLSAFVGENFHVAVCTLDELVVYKDIAAGIVVNAGTDGLMYKFVEE